MSFAFSEATVAMKMQQMLLISLSSLSRLIRDDLIYCWKKLQCIFFVTQLPKILILDMEQMNFLLSVQDYIMSTTFDFSQFT